MLLRAVAVAATLAISCAPTVDGVAERQRAVDRDDGMRLAAQLGALPGVWNAQVTLRRPVVDPLAPQSSPDRVRGRGRDTCTSTSTTASAAILVVTDDHADRAVVAAEARALVRGAAPEIADPEIVVEAGAPRAELSRVGPFSVERGSRRALIVTLAVALAAIAALALALAGYARRGSSAQ